MNEINKLIWPSATGHRDHEQGRLRPDGRDREAVRRDQEGADRGAYRTDLAEKAVAALKAKGVDVNGAELEARDGERDRGRQVSTAASLGAAAGGPGGDVERREMPCRC